MDKIKSLSFGNPSSFKSRVNGSFLLRYKGSYARDIPVLDSASISVSAFLTIFNFAAIVAFLCVSFYISSANFLCLSTVVVQTSKVL